MYEDDTAFYISAKKKVYNRNTPQIYFNSLNNYFTYNFDVIFGLDEANDSKKVLYIRVF